MPRDAGFFARGHPLPATRSRSSAYISVPLPDLNIRLTASADCDTIAELLQFKL